MDNRRSSTGWVQKNNPKRLGWKVWTILGVCFVLLLVFNGASNAGVFDKDYRQQAIDELLEPNMSAFDFVTSKEYDDVIIASTSNDVATDNLIDLINGVESEITFEDVELAFVELSRATKESYGDYQIWVENPINNSLYIIQVRDNKLLYSITGEEG